MHDPTRVRSHVLRSLSLALCLAAPLGCEEPSELDELDELDDAASDEDEELEFRWATPRIHFRTLVTSMNASGYGGNDGGCWDTAPSGNVRPFQQYRCHAKDNQVWLFETVPGVHGGFSIHSADDDDLCLDVPGFNTVSGQRLQMYPCNGGINQVWKVFNHDSQSATIRPAANTSLCLDVENGIKTNQSPIQLYGCTGAAHQAWRFHDWVGKDTSLSCDGPLRFGPEVVFLGARRSFAATGSHFNTLCSENFETDSVSCSSSATWFVVDSPWGSNDFDVRCFSTTAAN